MSFAAARQEQQAEKLGPCAVRGEPVNIRMSKIRILVVDDHAVLRAGLALLINSQPDMEVIAEAATVHEAVLRAREVDPDVVLLDLTLPDGSGLQALPDIHRDCPRARVLVLTMHDEPSYLMSALAAGATGYLVKSAEPAALRAAIQSVHRGRSYIDIPLSDGNLKALLAQRDVPARPSSPGNPAHLSRREMQILQLLALGHTYREIAQQLQLSARSVETYRARLSEKLGIRSRAGLVRHALLIGLLDEMSPV
jgi:DNA-binding NarL/FixJ family response regulator